MKTLSTTVLASTLFIIAGAAFAQEMTISYCQSADFSAACTESEDPAICTRKQNDLAQNCLEFLDQSSVKLKIVWNNFLASISPYFEELLGAIALFFAAAATYFRTALAKLRAKIFDPLIRRAADVSTLGLNVLVIGKGGSGKTSVIKALAGSDEINPNVSNAINAFYSVSHEMDTVEASVVNRRVLRLYFSDHVGQDFASIKETAYFKERKLEGLPKTIIFVVDLFDTDEAYGEDGVFDQVDKKRVQDHIRVYSPELLDIVTSGLPHKATIFLFINKIDKLAVPLNQIEKICLDAYKPLIQRLGNVPGSHLKVVAGSAETGQSVMGARSGASQGGTWLLYEGLSSAAKKIEG
ncbi:MAG: GTPase domain-containing protein [Paracoccaceae bacterium]